MVVAAIPSALLSIFGIIIMAHPRLLKDDNATAIYFACTQFILSVLVLVIGGYVANSIRGYQTLSCKPPSVLLHDVLRRYWSGCLRVHCDYSISSLFCDTYILWRRDFPIRSYVSFVI
jgi:hypothetical protein